MYHHGPNDIQNMFMFAFNNSILLECMRARCLMNNSIFETKGRHIIFNILQGIVSMKYTNESRTLIFYLIRKKLNNIEHF